MKKTLVAVCVLSFFPAAGSAGNCTGSAGAGDWQPGINLRGSMVCIRNAGDTGWENQEFHESADNEPSTISGDVVEYARGPSDTIDPTKKIGTWTALASDPVFVRAITTVRYDYDSGDSFTFDVYRNNNDPLDNRGIVFCESGTGTGLVAQGRRQGAVTSAVACTDW